MSLRIIDASVAIKWFVAEDSGREAALRILRQVESAPQGFAVPELFFNEMLAVLCRLCPDPARATEYLDSLQDLGLERIGNGRELLREAMSLALGRALTGYDAIYAASARLTGGKWLTADERAHKRLAGTGLSELVR